MKTLIAIATTLTVLLISTAEGATPCMVHELDVLEGLPIIQLQTYENTLPNIGMEQFYCAAPLGFLHGIGLEMGKTQYGLSSRSYPQIKAALEEIDILIGGQIF